MAEQPSADVLASPNATPTPAESTQAFKLLPRNWWNMGKTIFVRSALVATAFGTLIVTLYFLRIAYLPIDSLGSMASLSGIVALLACAFLSAFVVLWGAPSIVVYMAKSDKMWAALSLKLSKAKAAPVNHAAIQISEWRSLGVVIVP